MIQSDNYNLSVCFLARSVYNKYTPLMYRTIKNDFEPSLFGGFITSNSLEYTDVSKVLSDYREDIHIYEVSSYFKEHWEEFTYEKFLMYEKKYECEPLWNLIYMDRFLIYEDHDYCVKITAGYFQFFEMIFTEMCYDFYYDECISTLQSYIAYIVGKKFGVHYFTQTAPRGGMDAEYHIIITDPNQYIYGFDNNYININYTDDEMKKAEKYLSEFEEREMVPAYQLQFKEKPKYKIKYLLAPLRYLRARLNPYLNDQYFYMYKRAWIHALDMDTFYYRYKRSKKYYHKADFTKKYVYFPLHYQPENSTLMCAPKYEKQQYYIDSIAKSLPADTYLYVKEHYTLVGNRELSFYKEMRKYPNVVVISPWESSRDLILHAESVVTLTGTVGFEAMLLRKPVLCSGNVLFDMAPGVVKENDPYQKYTLFMKNWKQPDRKEILQYLCEYFRCMHEGGSNVWMEDAYEEDNIRRLVRAAYLHMMDTKKQLAKKERQ